MQFGRVEKSSPYGAGGGGKIGKGLMAYIHEGGWLPPATRGGKRAHRSTVGRSGRVPGRGFVRKAYAATGGRALAHAREYVRRHVLARTFKR